VQCTEHRRIAEVVLFLTFKRSDSRSAGRKRILSWNSRSRLFKVIHFAIICRTTRGSISSHIIACRISEVFEDVAEVYHEETRVMWLSSSEDPMIVAGIVLTQCQRVTDRQTDGRITIATTALSQLCWRAVILCYVRLSHILLNYRYCYIIYMCVICHVCRLPCCSLCSLCYYCTHFVLFSRFGYN